MWVKMAVGLWCWSFGHHTSRKYGLCSCLEHSAFALDSQLVLTLYVPFHHAVSIEEDGREGRRMVKQREQGKLVLFNKYPYHGFGRTGFFLGQWRLLSCSFPPSCPLARCRRCLGRVSSWSGQAFPASLHPATSSFRLPW